MMTVSTVGFVLPMLMLEETKCNLLTSDYLLMSDL